MYRIGKWQNHFGVPLPAFTQWELIEAASETPQVPLGIMSKPSRQRAAVELAVSTPHQFPAAGRVESPKSGRGAAFWRYGSWPKQHNQRENIFLNGLSNSHGQLRGEPGPAFKPMSFS